ncbi:MAG: hypothetical protein HY210_06530 [Candidatus Omnitrophica bacterium]|nr:hypothetical protein [Candidatus Omnitrophota bacterium]
MIIYEEIFREFQKQKVKYVLVGGMALKKKSNRPVDKLDIEDLKRIKILQGRHK